MAKPEHTRPFNLEHARAGAPYCVHDGQDASILKWDARYPGYPLLGTYGTKDHAMGWDADGKSSYGAHFNLVMTPLGLIDGKPVFVGDELEQQMTDSWVPEVAQPRWASFPADWVSGFRWPAPAPVYPETLMDHSQLHDAFEPKFDGDLWNSFTAKNIANAALRHAIDAGQVFPVRATTTLHFGNAEKNHKIYGEEEDIKAVCELRQAVRAAEEGRAARDMAIAEAVRDACRNNFTDPSNPAIKMANAYGRISNVNLRFIISTVQS